MPAPGAAPQRTSAEIRASIEANRVEFASSLDSLRGEVVKATDWRTQVAAHKRQVLIGASVAGFVLGGGLVALGGIFTRRGRR